VQGDFGRNAKSFMCPFHGWKYDVDGRNIRVVDRETFAPQTLCDIDLGPVHCEVLHGLVFVNMSSNPSPLRQYLGSISDVLESYKIENMYIVKDAQYTMLANWKSTIDAFQEAYHTQTTHPIFKQMVDEYFLQFDFYPNGHNRQLTPFLKVSHRLEDRTSVNPLIAASLAEVGIDPATYKGGAEGAREAVQKAKRRPDNIFGLDYSGFTDDQLSDDWNITVFPNITFNSHPEGVLIMRFRPHPTDMDRCYYDAQVFVPKLKDGARPPAYMGVGPEVDISGTTRPGRIYLQSDQAHHLGTVLEQDASNLPRVQAGLKSRGLGGYVRFAEHERRLQQFYCELDLYMDGPKGD
jgi:phenylpropionate dioxygenase-like ring-hydroxylating dioxygenase large terminal subunit